jgi:hypothetical protein
VLNVSNNNLKTLDRLQSLVSLRTLDVSGNELASLHRSVHVLVPLAKHLTRLDMRRNIVTAHPEYAGSVVRILLNIRHLDSRDLVEFSEMYSHSAGSTFRPR